MLAAKWGEAMSDQHPLHQAVQHITNHSSISAVYVPQIRYPDRDFSDDALLLEVDFDQSAMSVSHVVNRVDDALQQYSGTSVMDYDEVPGQRGTVRLRIARPGASP